MYSILIIYCILLQYIQFSIPLPKGGRNNQDLILTEDEYMLAMKKNRKKSDLDAFDPEYVFGNPNYKGSAYNSSGVEVGYGKKNPNVSRKK